VPEQINSSANFTPHGTRNHTWPISLPRCFSYATAEVFFRTQRRPTGLQAGPLVAEAD